MIAVDLWSFGLTVAVTGMAGTLFVLWILSLLILLLRRIFPASDERRGA